VLVEAGETVGAVFAALLGAMSITGEIRHGTIRPTLLTTPERGRVVASKTVVAMLSGLLFGLAASVLAAIVGTVVLSARGATIQLDGGDYALLLVGATSAATLWAVIGFGLGAIIRNQVAAIVATFVWLLIVENLLVDGIPLVSRFLPGTLGRAMSGQRVATLHTPVLAALLLVLYAATIVTIGWRITNRRDFA
jgi:ABC-type transport system involved in multi-copper enzyme maturation permease subunit